MHKPCHPPILQRISNFILHNFTPSFKRLKICNGSFKSLKSFVGASFALGDKRSNVSPANPNMLEAQQLKNVGHIPEVEKYANIVPYGNRVPASEPEVVITLLVGSRRVLGHNISRDGEPQEWFDVRRLGAAVVRDIREVVVSDFIRHTFFGLRRQRVLERKWFDTRSRRCKFSRGVLLWREQN
jgi:hypothetical protein